MDRINLRGDAKGRAAVPVYDLTMLAQIAHEMRQEITDPRLPVHARSKYAETIDAIDSIIDHAERMEEDEDADA